MTSGFHLPPITSSVASIPQHYVDFFCGVSISIKLESISQICLYTPYRSYKPDIYGSYPRDTLGSWLPRGSMNVHGQGPWSVPVRGEEERCRAAASPGDRSHSMTLHAIMVRHRTTGFPLDENECPDGRDWMGGRSNRWKQFL